MIFSCGENHEARNKRLSEWHDFFPLFPRTVDVVNGRDVCAWLEHIERKGTGFYDSYGELWTWEYRRKQ